VDSLDIVCFVQDNDTREVLQAHMEPATPQTAQNVDIVLAPINPPIQIPASGGNFRFDVTLTNNMTAPLISMPGSCSSSLMESGRADVGSLLAERSGVRHHRPRAWPECPLHGAPWHLYLSGYVGMYNADARWDSSSFTYTKLTTGDGPLVSDWNCIEEEVGGVEKPLTTHELSLITSVLPNPFNPVTTISYQLSADSYVGLKVYNTAGRLVATLVDGWRQAGEHKATFDASELPSGIYFAKMETGGSSQVQKLVLLK